MIVVESGGREERRERSDVVGFALSGKDGDLIYWGEGLLCKEMIYRKIFIMKKILLTDIEINSLVKFLKLKIRDDQTLHDIKLIKSIIEKLHYVNDETWM